MARQGCPSAGPCPAHGGREVASSTIREDGRVPWPCGRRDPQPMSWLPRLIRIVARAEGHSAEVGLRRGPQLVGQLGNEQLTVLNCVNDFHNLIPAGIELRSVHSDALVRHLDVSGKYAIKGASTCERYYSRRLEVSYVKNAILQFRKCEILRIGM